METRANLLNKQYAYMPFVLTALVLFPDKKKVKRNAVVVGYLHFPVHNTAFYVHNKPSLIITGMKTGIHGTETQRHTRTRQH